MSAINRRAFLTATGCLLARPAGFEPCVPGAAPPAAGPLPVPTWVRGVTRMTFTSDIEAAARAGAQVVHTNLIWPYFPLRRDGGGLAKAEAAAAKRCLEAVTASADQRHGGDPPSERGARCPESGLSDDVRRSGSPPALLCAAYEDRIDMDSSSYPERPRPGGTADLVGCK